MKKIHLDAAKAVLTEVNPYELPLPFSNVGLYHYLRRIRFYVDDLSRKHYVRCDIDDVDKEILSILIDGNPEIDYQDSIDREGARLTHFQMLKRKYTIPFRFDIVQPGGKLRELSYLNPAGMLQVSAFHKTYNNDVLYFLRRSPVSLRSASAVAKSFRASDVEELADNVDSSPSTVEEVNKRYAFVRSFFRYRPYSSMWKFFDSGVLENMERRYRVCRRVDFSRCFDSIYTHSIGWVTNGQSASKAARNPVKDTFGAAADKLAQNINYRETNGIVIGPEWSRTFAEVILQEVDLALIRSVQAEIGLEFGVDYHVYRYIDDWFIFAAGEDEVQCIERILTRVARSYKLHINEAKSVTFRSPFIFSLTAAKRVLGESVDQLFAFRVDAETGDLSIRFDDIVALQLFKDVLVRFDAKPHEVVNFYLGRLLGAYESMISRLETHVVDKSADLSRGKLVPVEIMVEECSYRFLKVASILYSYAPSVALAIKFARITHIVRKRANSVIDSRLLSEGVQEFCERMCMEAFEGEVRSNGLSVQALILLDCLTSFGFSYQPKAFTSLFSEFWRDLPAYNAMQLLVLVRHFREEMIVRRLRVPNSLASMLLAACKEIIDAGVDDPSRSTERVLLRISLSECPFIPLETVRKCVGLSAAKVERIRERKWFLLFNWDIDDEYLFRLAAKVGGAVY